MSAPAAFAANAQSNAASALAGTKSPGRETAEASVASDQPANFASLLRHQIPGGDEFAALQQVKLALESPSAEEHELFSGDLAALLAEISQPLAPTTIPLMPVAQTAAPTLLPSLESPAQSAARLLVELPPQAASAAQDTAAGDAGSALLNSGQDSSARQGEFKLPDTTPLALAQALTQATHVQGPTAPHAPAGQVTLAANQPLQSPQWSSEVGQNLVWMAKNDVQTARLNINPPQLGPIEITLSLNKDQATAQFVSAHSEVREILERALPRLREILEGAGVQLGQADVGAQSQQKFARDSSRPRHGGSEFGLEAPTLRAGDAVMQAGAGRLRHGNGLVNTFA